MDATFTHQLNYLAKTFDGTIEIDDQNDGWLLKPTPVVITFQELDQTTRAQHKFHFRLIAFFSNAKKKEGFGSQVADMDLDTSELYDMTVEYLNKYSISDPINFSAQVREEVLNDFGALSSLAFFFLNQKFYPFFQKLAPSMQL